MRKVVLLALFASALAPTVRAQAVDVPLRNWTVPPYTRSSAGGGLSTMTDISRGIAFVAVTPCRIADTRGNGFTGQAGPPLLNTGPRSFQVTGTVPGAPTPCGIPSGADAVSFQFTVVTPNAAGNLIAWPGGTAPTVSVLNWSAGETALGNGTIVPLSDSGSLSVQINAAVGNATAHLVIDVNGYFSERYTPENLFQVNTTNDGGEVILGINSSSVGFSRGVKGVVNGSTPQAGAMGVEGEITSTTPDHLTAGVRGINRGAGNAGIGVWGFHAGGGHGVFGETSSGIGVYGKVTGSGGYGVFGESPTGTGVYGKVSTATGVTTGVYGETPSGLNGSAGVRGIAGSLFTLTSPYQVAGIRGQSPYFGVVGISPFLGVGGSLVNGAGVETDWGALGHAGYGVYSFGGVGGTGAKQSIDPHPTDPTKVIRYVSLDGPEPGTYFRGRGRFERGIARIQVPEDFRMVTDGDGLTVQVTPIGGMASVGVLKADLNEIVVQSSRNLEFYYMVNGIRRTHKHLTSPIGDGQEFMPRSPDDKMPLALTEGQKQMLIENGTYRPDGTVNMETARRNGWDRIWEERARPTPAPAAE